MKSFLGQKLFFFTAHPDDESYGAAGTIFKNYQAGGSTMLICASYGEKGTSHLKKKVPVSKFKKIREKELKKAAKLLHIAPVHILGIPDGKFKQNIKKIYEKGLWYVKIYKPQTIVSFGPDGLSGHLDHIIIGEIAKRIAKKLRITYIIFIFPPRVVKEIVKYLKKRRLSGSYATSIRYKKPNVRIKINPVIKKRALGCHRSQMDGMNAFTGFPGYAVKELLKAEYFIVK